MKFFDFMLCSTNKDGFLLPINISKQFLLQKFGLQFYDYCLFELSLENGSLVIKVIH